MINRGEVIDYFKEYEKIKVKLVPRELEVPLGSSFIVSVIGPRRAGKTYYFFSLFDKVRGDHVYLNFEDSRLCEATYKEIREIIRIFVEVYGKEPKYLFFDEIQNIDKWETAVRELHDLKKYKIFLTGSSSKLLSREIATQLRGRALSYVLLPFSFREFLFARGIQVGEYLTRDDEAKIKNLLRSYLDFGGFPDVVKNKQKLNILREYYDLILFRDFIERHKIRNIDLARALSSFVIQNFSKEISLRTLFGKIKGTNIKAAKDSVYDYVTKLEDTLFFFFLRRFSEKAHLRETWPKKIYLCDTGLARVVKFSPDYGRAMENAVFLELLRSKNKNPLIDVFYYNLPDGEVDFVVTEGLKVKQLIQVTYASSRDEIEKREVRSLLKAGEELNCRNLLVITWDYEGEEKHGRKRIRFLPLWKWLIYEKRKIYQKA